MLVVLFDLHVDFMRCVPGDDDFSTSMGLVLVLRLRLYYTARAMTLCIIRCAVSLNNGIQIHDQYYSAVPVSATLRGPPSLAVRFSDTPTD
jgi:hypothetical protein